MSNRNKPVKRKYFDYPMLIIIVLLLAFGLVMIYSTSYYASSLENEGNGLQYLKQQTVSTLVGLFFMGVACIVPYKLYKKLYIPIYVLAFILVLLILTPLGHAANGATRWIRIGKLSLQVAEPVKAAVIVFTATVLTKMPKTERTSVKAMAIVLAPAALLSGMIVVLTDDFSSGVVIGGIAFVIYLLSSPNNYKPLILLGIIVVLGALIVVMMVKGVGADIWGFRGERVLAWLDPEKYIDGKGYQPLQALYGIGSGGFLGKGLGKSMQKLGKLPEAHNDMIFSIICEELGIVGGILVMVLFALLLWRLKDIASYTTDYFGNLIITGVFAQIAIQSVLNIAVVTSVIPNTGISLPFISYGGSSVMLLLAELGIVMNISRNVDFNDAAERSVKQEKASGKEENE